MHNTTISGNKRTFESLGNEIIHSGGDIFCHLRTIAMQCANACTGADGVQAKAHTHSVWWKAKRFAGISKGMRVVTPARAAIKRDVDTGIEIHTLQNVGDEFGFCVDAKAMRTNRIFKDKRQTIRAIL